MPSQKQLLTVSLLRNILLLYSLLHPCFNLKYTAIIPFSFLQLMPPPSGRRTSIYHDKNTFWSVRSLTMCLSRGYFTDPSKTNTGGTSGTPESGSSQKKRGRPRSSASSVGPLACDFEGCEYRAKWRSHLEIHQRTHTGNFT